MREELSAGMNPTPHTKFQDSFAEEVWRSTYKYHEDETIDDTLKRVARAIASVEETDELKEKWTNKFYDMLSEFKALPGGRTIANAGAEFNGTTLANCFVSPRRNYDIDSIEGILEDVLNQCQTLKSEGGWGQNFSFIRPRGAFIHGIGVETPGAIKYMEIYDKTSDIITSGSGTKSKNKKAKGKIRKGAMMAILDDWHPDVEEFIRAKQTPGRLTKFNVSVNFSDLFMQKLLRIREIDNKLERNDFTSKTEANKLQEEKDEHDKWYLRFPDTTADCYEKDWDGDIVKWENAGNPVKIYKTVSITGLWNMVMESTYQRAEPGVIFLDRGNYFNPLNYKEKIVSSNPCGEQQLSSGNICTLGTLNLTQFVLSNASGFNLDKIKKYVHYLVRFLDNVNTYSNAPLPEYKESMMKKRRIGIGVMGWGSSLFMMKIRFGSNEADRIREEMISTIARESYIASIDLAEEKGMFEYCNPKKHAEGAFISNLQLEEDDMERLKKYGIRNASLLSCQPNGNCVTKEGKIKMMDGSFYTIEQLISLSGRNIDTLKEGDVVKLDGEIVIPTFEGQDVFDSIYVNGKKPVLEVKLEDGTTLKQTINHKYLVKINEDEAKWIESKDLKPGMSIISAN
jgi:ribonucleoside-diphosphate reductase alpha chain